METIELNEDITVMYVDAKSFPDGIMEAHNKLQEIVGKSMLRRLFGISRPEEELDGNIGYKAAAEEAYAGEAEKFHLGSMSIKKGKYVSVLVENYLTHPERINEVFQELLQHPMLDQVGYCVEWYVNDHDVRCMVRIIE